MFVAQLCPTFCKPMDCSQALLSMEFSSQEYWSGLPFLSPGDLPDPGTEPWPSALQEDCLLSEPPGKLDRGVVVILSQGTGVACGPQVSTGALTLAPATSLPYFLELLKLDSGPWGHSTLSLARLALRGFLLLDTPHTVLVISFFLLWPPLQLLGTASPGWMGQPENWWSIPTDKRSVARPLGSLPSGGAEAMFSQTCSLSQDGAWLSALSFRPRRKHLELGLWGRFGEARVLGQDCLPVVRSESGGCTLQTGPAWLGSTEGEAPHCHLQHPLSKAPRGMLSWKRVSSPY